MPALLLNAETPALVANSNRKKKQTLAGCSSPMPVAHPKASQSKVIYRTRSLAKNELNVYASIVIAYRIVMHTRAAEEKDQMTEAMMQPPVTFMIMIYNQARFITDAVQSAFSQEYDGPLEILLSDDASTDGTTEILHSLVAGYDGPHRVRLNVNRRNLGLMAHFNKVFALASHDFVVCGAGDDISRSDRVAHLARLQAETDAWLLYSRTEFMNSAGKMLPDPGIATTFAIDWTLPDVARSNALFIGAGSAYHKDVLRTFGPIIEKHAFEDLVLGFRAALCERIAYCDEPLVQYRLGEGLSRAGRTSFQERSQALAVWIAVLRQRLTDAKGFGLAFDDPIMETLRDTLSQAQSALFDHLKVGPVADTS